MLPYWDSFYQKISQYGKKILYTYAYHIVHYLENCEALNEITDLVHAMFSVCAPLECREAHLFCGWQEKKSNIYRTTYVFSLTSNFINLHKILYFGQSYLIEVQVSLAFEIRFFFSFTNIYIHTFIYIFMRHILIRLPTQNKELTKFQNVN